MQDIFMKLNKKKNKFNLVKSKSVLISYFVKGIYWIKNELSLEAMGYF